MYLFPELRFVCGLPWDARIFFGRGHVVRRFRVSGLIYAAVHLPRAHMVSAQIGSNTAWRAHGAPLRATQRTTVIAPQTSSRSRLMNPSEIAHHSEINSPSIPI